MENKDLQNMIDLYFDGELTSEQESLLFISLSGDEMGRNYFKRLHLLKSVTENMNEDFPQQLEEKIFHRIFHKERESIFRKKVNPLFVYPLILLLLFISIFYYTEVNNYRKDVNKIYNDLQQQKEIIQSILNPLPAAEIKGINNNQIIITAKKI